MAKELSPSFQPESSRLSSLLSEQDRTIEGRIPLGISFLDDCLGGFYPGDFLIFAADTGVGKTSLAVSTAMAGVRAGKQVYLFALEAKRGEVASRLYFTELGRRAKEPRLDFAGWVRGQWRHLDRKYSKAINADLEEQLANLHVLYKNRGDFTPHNLEQKLEQIADEADVVVLDHIHVIDDDDKQSELQTQRRVVRLLADMALDLELQVAAVSHTRKRKNGGVKTLLPDIEDLHGSSNLQKVSTQLVLAGREWDGPFMGPEWSSTLMQVPKDRNGRHSTIVARVGYDRSTGLYAQDYQLGKVEWKDRKQQWIELPADQIPHWAKHEMRAEVIEDDLDL